MALGVLVHGVMNQLLMLLGSVLAALVDAMALHALDLGFSTIWLFIIFLKLKDLGVALTTFLTAVAVIGITPLVKSFTCSSSVARYGYNNLQVW